MMDRYNQFSDPFESLFFLGLASENVRISLGTNDRLDSLVMTINDLSLAEAMELLDQLRDPQQRFIYLVERARKRMPLPDAYRLDVNRVEGCQVRTWWIGEIRSHACWFGLDSDAVTLKALGGFLCEQATSLSLQEQQQFQADMLEKWGVLRQLADNRRATILRLASKIRDFASNSGLSRDHG